MNFDPRTAMSEDPTLDEFGRVYRLLERGSAGVTIAHHFAYPDARTTVVTTLETAPRRAPRITVTTITLDEHGIPTVTIR